MAANDYLVKIGPDPAGHCALGLGCWVFGGAQWGGQEDADSISAMQAALDLGITHFDTASGYGGGRSETLVGEFLKERREGVYLASKFFPSQPTAQFALEQLDLSLKRLQTDCVDLYYIHWPSTGKDLRPAMEGLEQARAQGKLKAIGVSNFNAEQMAQLAEAGRIDAHQVRYNAFWRYPERDVIPYCVEHGISVVTYSSIAQGILTGKLSREPQFKEGDQRGNTVYFDAEVWPHVYAGVEQLKALAAEANRPLTHLAILWAMKQPGITSVLVGARQDRQMRDNAAALEGEVPEDIFIRMSAITDEVMLHIPDVGNIFRFYP
jgi:aryl-alcohol dehydrogenase-like predicted oxidoreductase